MDEKLQKIMEEHSAAANAAALTMEDIRAAEKAKNRRIRRKKAIRGFFVQSVTAVILCACLWLAEFFGMVDARLAIPLMIATCVWISFRAGAFVQFMSATGRCKGDGSVE